VNQEEVKSLESGTMISNRYHIVKLLGQGGMGCVYLARDTILNNAMIALKVLHSQISENESHSKRFLREVELMRKVNNPNVVRTFDVAIDKGLLYYTMEYVEGVSLEEMAKDNPLSYKDLSEIIIGTCEGLEAIHEQEIVHRDLKPANIIILEDNKIKITDFGVARNKNSNLTKHDEIIGSANYIAPEIWLGKPITNSVDLYSLGIILFELLVGRVPFEEDEPAAMMWFHIKEAPTPPKSIRESTPNWLNQLTLKLLSKRPEDRPINARAVVDLIKRNNKVNQQSSRKSAVYPRASTGNSGLHRESKRYSRSHKKNRFSSFWKIATGFVVSAILGLAVYCYYFLSKFLHL